MTVSVIVRKALQVRAAEVADLPASRNYEGYLPNGKPFQPVKGTPFVRFTMIPTSIVTAALSNSLFRHEGLFQIDLFYPPKGTKAIEDMGDAVRAKFKSGLRLTTTENRVLIRSSNRAAIQQDVDWLQLPITIAWRYYSSES